MIFRVVARKMVVMVVAREMIFRVVAREMVVMVVVRNVAAMEVAMLVKALMVPMTFAAMEHQGPREAGGRHHADLELVQAPQHLLWGLGIRPLSDTNFTFTFD